MISFWSQFKALVWKNVLLKKRNKKQLIQELLMPIYFVAILVMIKAFVKPTTYPVIKSIPSYSLYNSSFQPNFTQKILVAPNLTYVQDVALTTGDVLKEILNLSSTPSFQFYEDSAAAEKGFEIEREQVVAGIVFDYSDGDEMSYAIRTPYGNIAGANSVYGNQGSCRAGNGLDESLCAANTYLYSGFSVLQVAIDTALIRSKINRSDFPVPDLSVQMMPKPEYKTDTSYIQIVSSIYFVMAYAPFINFLTVNLVAEKEKKIKEGMKMMGMRDSAFWLSWSFVYTVLIILVTTIVTIIALASKFFSNSNIFLFFLMLVEYGLSIIAMSFVITPFFNKAQEAGGLASLFSMIISLLYLVVSLTRTYSSTGVPSFSISPAERWALCLLSPVAIALAIDQGIYLDLSGRGMGFDTISSGDFPLYAPMIMLLFDTILYFFIAVYLDNVVPSAYGSRYPPWFCFMKSYWLPRHPKDMYVVNGLQSNENAGNTNVSETPDIEPVPQIMQNSAAIRLFNITKIFNQSKQEEVVAVNGLSLDIYEGQITALLGHNGAGKTTLVNMLCGLTGPTVGTATIMGLDVSQGTDMNQIRSMTGVCPQHNILFDVLSCEEHLKLFAAIKGVPDKDVDKEVSRALKEVDLSEQESVHAKDLSGGQKRKLSVAIALIGDPKVVFLDEPTSGMDPCSRRHLWRTLKENKAGRVILLTTHFMDEADILADRKAIISHGRLRCCGSSLFLKNRFGIGYHLNMVVDPDTDHDQITEMIRKKIDGAELKRIHGKEMNFTLPLNQVTSFPDLFTFLDGENGKTSNAESHGIKSYGVSMTSLEEVFLKLESDDNLTDIAELAKPTNNVKSSVRSSQNPSLTTDHESSNVTVDFVAAPMDQQKTLPELRHNPTTTKNQVKALCKVRVLRFVRQKGLLVVQLFVPVVLLVIGLLLSKLTTTDAFHPEPIGIGFPMYVGNASHPVDFTPQPLLAKDSVGTTSSGFYLAELESFMAVDDYTSIDDLLKTGPHNLGIDMQGFNMTAGEVVSSAFKCLYNDSAVHGIPAIINLLMSSTMQVELRNNSVFIRMSSWPWPADKQKYQFDKSAFSSIILIGMAFVFIAPAFAVEIVRDRQTKVRSQLRVSGVTSSMYWGTMFLVDMTKYAVPIGLSIICILAIQVESLKPAGALITLLLVCITYMPSNMLFSYVFSFAFSNFETAQAMLLLLFMMMGLVPYMAMSLVDMIGSETTGSILHYVFTVIDPPYNVFGGVYFIDKIYRKAQITSSKVTVGEYFDPANNVLVSILMPILHCLLCFLLLRILDIKTTGGNVREALPSCNKSSLKSRIIPELNSDIIDDEDEDVSQERTRVHDIQQRNVSEWPVALVEDLRKQFTCSQKGSCDCKKTQPQQKLKIAVRNATFAVEAGEVLGLLGPNGAGKTTTLNMMIAETGPSRGKVVLGGHNIRSSMSEAFLALGYCPQHDSLWNNITLKEHIECYCAVRGVHQSDIPTVVDYFIENLKVSEHANKHADKLSGGTKRKLSYAMAMLGNPKIALLDEPSTGLDPQSKRFLWDTISTSFNGNERGAILTTHYMEEADALCSRVAIMVNGKIECLGETQHLKNKYGSGYLLEVKLNIAQGDIDERMDQLDQFVRQLFPAAVHQERFAERAQYKVPKSDVKLLGRTFAALENAKQSHGLEEYSFSQSTLEQVFLEFAKRQLDENMDDNQPNPPIPVNSVEHHVTNISSV